IAAVVVFGLMRFVVPIFLNMFTAMEVELPLPTKIVMEISNLTKTFGIFIPFVGYGLYFAFNKIYATPAGRWQVDSLMLKAPVMGMLLRKIAVARFTRTLG